MKKTAQTVDSCNLSVTVMSSDYTMLNQLHDHIHNRSSIVIEEHVKYSHINNECKQTWIILFTPPKVFGGESKSRQIVQGHIIQAKFSVFWFKQKKTTKKNI